MASVNIKSTTNKVEGSPEGDYGALGLGNTDVAYREATRKGPWPNDNENPGRSQGETPGAGSIYAAMLNERPNLSNPRNRGPERPPSRSASTGIPVVMQSSRMTGRVSG